MKKRTILLVFSVCLLLLLTGCGSNNTTRPITNNEGWFENLMVVPIGYILQFFAKSFNNNFAIGILFSTIIVRTICWPIYAKSNDYMLKMNLLNPELQRLQQKYAGKNDPASQQQMQAEMMKLYKKYDMNPLGCFVAFLQMPVFMAMYQVVVRFPLANVVNEAGEIVYESIFIPHELLDYKLFGFIDLSVSSQQAGWQGLILPVLVGVTMIVLQYFGSKKPKYAKNNPNPQAEAQAAQMQKTMKIMNYVMVAMMVVMSASNGALAFYWVVGNLFSLGQQLISRELSNRKYEKLKNSGLIGG